LNILFYTALSDGAQWLAALSRALPDAQLLHWPRAKEVADYAVVWKPPPELIANLAGVRAVFNLGAGVDAIAGAVAWPRDVPLVRLEDAGMAEQMVEYAVYAVLRFYREFAAYERAQRARSWAPRARLDKRGFSVGILGMGVLGSQVADALRRLGFSVTGFCRQHKVHKGVETLAGDRLAEFLTKCHVLVCMLPLTPATRGLLDRQAFAQLPRGAYVVNVARGGIVVERDLLAAIDSGHLAGAMLDVSVEEPLPAEHAFWHHPRITLTPHIAAVTRVEESVAQIADKIRRIEAGLPVGGIVHPQHAY
jgi:glyoxylate/hydroxypyruvate reductase A